MADFSDVPTLKEVGYDVTLLFLRGIAAAPGIPAEASAFYENMIKRDVRIIRRGRKNI